MNYFETLSIYFSYIVFKSLFKFENKTTFITFSVIFLIKMLHTLFIYSSLGVFCLCIGMLVPQHVCKIRGQLAGVGSPLPPSGFQGVNSGGQTGQQGPLPHKPSCRPCFDTCPPLTLSGNWTEGSNTLSPKFILNLSHVAQERAL